MVSSQIEPERTSTKLVDQDAIKVLGVGRTGIRILHRLFKQRISDAGYYALYTDQFHCEGLHGPEKVQIGKEVTGCRGAAGDPETGLLAAQESSELIRQIVRGSDLVIIAAGLGAGTGSGVTPYVASLAKEAGAPVMVAVTMPYGFEAAQRRNNAENALASLKDIADTVVAVSLDKTMQLGEIDENEAMKRAYSILDEGIQNVLKVAGPAQSKGRLGAVSAMLSLAALH